jgi:hypothetical protein
MSIAMRRTRIGLALLLALVLSAVALARPVLAGEEEGQCSLLATVGGGSATEVEIGEEVLVEGFDFPPNADIEITIIVEGMFLRNVIVTSDGGGFFETTLVPALGESGLWSVETLDIEELCTAAAAFLVLPGPTPAPSPTPAPTVEALPDVAVPPSGGSVPVLVLLGMAFLLAGGSAGLALAQARRRP